MVILTLFISGCTDNNSSPADTDEGMVINDTGLPLFKDDWCPTENSFEMSNPRSDEMLSMKIQGEETVEGIVMCKAVFSGKWGDDYKRGEYLWSEDRNNYIFSFYDSKNDIVSQVKKINGKLTHIDEQGNVFEFEKLVH
ncbi:MAG: hypothetical protein E4G94_07505 [ANME-2 cluster archaeon]|nr:MAG: hypothetical protein E4G94_07505 [ANME-2 cluster archaeon]